MLRSAATPNPRKKPDYEISTIRTSLVGIKTEHWAYALAIPDRDDISNIGLRLITD